MEPLFFLKNAVKIEVVEITQAIERRLKNVFLANEVESATCR